MKSDLYLRAVLTTIAAALVYLCIALTPLPGVRAQTAPRPGDDTGPARVVVVGWSPDVRAAVQVLDSITLKTTGETRVVGTVQTEQRQNTASRVIVAGWEEGGSDRAAGAVHALGRGQQTGQPSGIPVTTVPVP